MAGIDRENSIVCRWLARRGAEMLHPALDLAYPVEEASCFDDALDAIDDAERQVWSDGEATPGRSSS